MSKRKVFIKEKLKVNSREIERKKYKEREKRDDNRKIMYS